MKCQELMAALNDYLDGAESSALCQEFQRHLRDCPACQVVVDNVRHTILLCKDGQTYEIPAPCREKLRQALREKWRQKHPSAA